MVTWDIRYQLATGVLTTKMGRFLCGQPDEEAGCCDPWRSMAKELSG
jgi:hypothetical protein